MGEGLVSNIYVFMPFVWNHRIASATGSGSSSIMPYWWGSPVATTSAIILRNHFVAFGTDNALDMWGAWGFKEGIDEIDWVIMMN